MSESEDGHRSYGNVIANGGLPGLVAIFAWISGDWYNGMWMFCAAVAVAASDTFASEIGCLDDNVRMITTMKPCEPGLNGGFSPTGQKAAFAGSAMIAVLAFIAWMIANNGGDALEIGLGKTALVAIIGWLGCQMDSVLGAVFENRGYLTKGGVNGISITFGMLMMWSILSSEYLSNTNLVPRRHCLHEPKPCGGVNATAKSRLALAYSAGRSNGNQHCRSG